MCALEKVWVCVCSASFFISHTHTHSHTCLPYEYKVSVCAHIHMRASRSATGVPKALLGHKVAKQKSRPTIPVVIPEGYKALMTRCWSHRPEDRCVCVRACAFFVNVRHALEMPPRRSLDQVLEPQARGQAACAGKGAKQICCGCHPRAWVESEHGWVQNSSWQSVIVFKSKILVI